MRVVADNLYAREPAPLLNVGIVDTLVLVVAAREQSSRFDRTRLVRRALVERWHV